jgi:hypothetical protein
MVENGTHAAEHENACPARSPGGWHCCIPIGHDGNHIGVTEDFGTLYQWAPEPETDPDQAEAERITGIQPSGDRSGAADSANVQAAVDALPSGPVIYVDTSSDPDQAEAERIAEVFDQARTDADQEHRP